MFAAAFDTLTPQINMNTPLLALLTLSLASTLANAATVKQCDGTLCAEGCCPEVDWFCCANGVTCAPVEADCIDVRQGMPLAKDSRQCDGTLCAEGCCPEVDWFCCANGVTCAPVEADCLDDVKAARFLASLI